MSFLFKRWRPEQSEPKTEKCTSSASQQSEHRQPACDRPLHTDVVENQADEDGDLFGDMDLDFSSTVSNSTSVESQSNIDQLRDLVLTEANAIKLTKEANENSSKFDFIYRDESDKKNRKIIDVIEQSVDTGDDTTEQYRSTDRQLPTKDKNMSNKIKGKNDDATTASALSSNKTVTVSEENIATSSKVKDVTKQTKDVRVKKTKKSRMPGTANKQFFESASNAPGSVGKDKDDFIDDIEKPSEATMERNDCRTNKNSSERLSPDNSNDNEIGTFTLVDEMTNQEIETDNEKKEDIFSDNMVMEIDNVNARITAPTSNSTECNVDNEDDFNEGTLLYETKKNKGENVNGNNKEIREQANPQFDDNAQGLVLDLDEDETFQLSAETLKMEINNLRLTDDALKTRRDLLLADWISSKVDIESIPERVKDLQEKQQRLAEQDEFDQAEAIEQESRDLILKGERYKYQHPLLNEKVSQIIVDFKGRCLQLAAEKTRLLSSLRDTLTRYEERSKSKESTNDREVEEQELHFKEVKLMVDGKLSHLALDKEHLLKRKGILKNEIEKKTSSLSLERQEIIDKRTLVQTKIKELEEELKKLQIEDKAYSEDICKIDARIDEFRIEFQPRLQKIENEQEEILKREENASAEKNEVQRKIDEIAEQKSKIREGILRNENTAEGLRKGIKELKDYDIISNSGDNDFVIDDIVDINTFITEDDKDLSDLKMKITEVEAEYQRKFEEVLSGKSRITSLQRCVKDLESKLTELEKAKKNAAKEKKYQDAKRLSDEIKRLTEEGESKQMEVLQIEESLKSDEMQMKTAHDQVTGYKNEYEDKLKEFDFTIMNNLEKIQVKIETYLESNPDTWFRSILDLQLSTNKEIIKSLKMKHCFHAETPQIEELNDQICEKISDLEHELEGAEIMEDWDLAEKLYNEIKELKTKYGIQ